MSLVKKVCNLKDEQIDRFIVLNDKLNEKMGGLKNINNAENFIYDSISIVNSLKLINEEIEWFLENCDNNFEDNQSKQTHMFQEQLRKKVVLIHILKSLKH